MSGYYGPIGYDEELPAGFQDADFEMREMEYEGNRIARLRKRGICTHQSGMGYRSPAVYPEQEEMKPGQMLCTDICGKLFDSEDEMYEDSRNKREFA